MSNSHGDRNSEQQETGDGIMLGVVVSEVQYVRAKSGCVSSVAFPLVGHMQSTE
jgi:hypothetical protein